MNFFDSDTLQPTKLSPAEKSGQNVFSGIRSFLPSQLLKKGWNAATPVPVVSAKSVSDSSGKEFKAKDKVTLLDTAARNLGGLPN